ncbi:MAG TPA: molybdenum ABC transporter ATP-binding protein [Burkholderiales bacterium]|nr:molybdenum ABC transporter ATP-binding protein [Burkholderiales bacterium]
MLDIDVARKLGAFQLEARFASSGGVTALFGRSGSGKSTVINVIAGLIRPDWGHVRVGNAVLFDHARKITVPPNKRRVGYVFQDGNLLPHLSVQQNLRYGMFFNGTQERFTEFDQIVDLLDLSRFLQRKPGSLSGGERKRVAIGRALLASPRLLLMDEPLAQLDNARKSEILYYIERLRDEVKIPIVYVSHSIEEVVRLADTVVVMSEGQAIAVGPVQDVMGRIDLHPYTGRYEGGAVIEAKVLAHDSEFDLTTLRFAGGELLCPGIDALIGETVRVRIRARDVSLALERPPGLSILNIFPARVVEISAETGAIAEVKLDVSGAALVARITKRSALDLALSSGKSVYALVKAVSLDRHSLGLV